MRVIAVDNNSFFLIKQAHKLTEGLLDILERTVVIKVVCLNIGDYHHVRVKEHKRTIRLICLADKILAVSVFAVGVVALNNTANQK